MATRKITLTDRAPIQIEESDWPTIAKASWSDNPRIPSQANRKAWIRVRRHANSRVLVYGGFDSDFPSEPDLRAGRLLGALDGIDADKIVEAIHIVAGRIGHPSLGDDCIADLPAEQI